MKRIMSKKVVLMLGVIAIVFPFIFSCSPVLNSAKGSFIERDEMLRGFEITADLNESDIIDLKNYGANLVRVMFADDKLISKTEPHIYNETAWKKLDYMIMHCKKYGIKLVINPHTFPGFSNDYTTNPADDFWTNTKLQDEFVKMWKAISDRYKHNTDVIWGYDLLNEPAVKDPAIWNNLVRRLVKTIRDNDDNTPIIIEAFVLVKNGKYQSRNETLDLLELPDNSNIIFSTHFYEPHEYTHQMVSPGYKKMGYNEPGLNAKQMVQEDIQRIRSFQLKHPNLPVYIGEFSVSRIATDGNDYLKDLIDACERYGWHWTYHAFRESYYWDAEMADGTLEILPRTQEASRITLLKSYFKKNKFNLK